MSALPFQGGVIFRTFAPDSGFGTYAMLTARKARKQNGINAFYVNEFYEYYETPFKANFQSGK
jgi:hypothetical protein